MQYRLIRLACVVGWLASDGIADEPPPRPAPASSSLVTSAVLKLGETRWSFKPAKGGPGLAVQWESGIARGDFTLNDGLLAGDIVGIAATGRLYTPETTGIALGVAVRPVGGQAIAYGLVWSGGDDAKMRKASTWTTSRALRTTPIDRPFHTLTLAMPEGDTVLFTIQRLDRNWPAGENKLETHSFVNNCTINGIADDATLHYSGVLQKQNDMGPAGKPASGNAPPANAKPPAPPARKP